MRKPARHGQTAKHSSSKHAAGRHHGTAKHAPKAPAKTPVRVGKPAGGGGTAKPRRLTLGGIALCPAEAVAAAARMAGWMVTDEDVLDLYARCADGPSSGFTIAAALTASLRRGLTGFAPLDTEEVMPLDRWCNRMSPADELLHSGPEPLVTARAGLILGIDLPGPHAVAVAPDGCWVSWGEHFDPAGFPDAVIDEAWAVSLA